MQGDIEVVMARHTVMRAVVVGPILVGIFWAFRGLDGAFASLIGVLVVAGYFVLSGFMLAVAARISQGAYHAAALFGFFLRLGLIAVTMFGIAALIEDIDRPALGITVVVAFLALVAWEAVAVATGRERELEWIG
jgi:hypothetical protein